MRKRSLFLYLFRFVAAVFCIYGIVVLCVIGPGYFFNWFYLAAGIFLFVLAFLLERLRGISKKIYVIALIPILLLAFSFLFVEFQIVSFSMRGCDPDARYVIVLGSQIRSDGPSNDYKARLDSAYEYLMEYPDVKLITTGGKGENEPISEGEGGAVYLKEKGIAETRILVEDESVNTYENLANAGKIMKEDGGDIGRDGIVIVSADYHLFRASLLARELGYKNVSFKGGHGLAVLLPHYYTREFFALIKEAIS